VSAGGRTQIGCADGVVHRHRRLVGAGGPAGLPRLGPDPGTSQRAVRRELDRYRGREVDTASDGFFAVFEGPARAVRCALEAERTARSLGLGLEIRSGAHTGECELA
jgi:hypothetical protein